MNDLELSFASFGIDLFSPFHTISFQLKGNTLDALGCEKLSDAKARLPHTHFA